MLNCPKNPGQLKRDPIAFAAALHDGLQAFARTQSAIAAAPMIDYRVGRTGGACPRLLKPFFRMFVVP